MPGSAAISEGRIRIFYNPAGWQTAAAKTLVVSGMTTQLTATDAYGNHVPSYRGTIHFTSSSARATLPADYTFTTSDPGVHTFSVTLKTAGTQWVRATDKVTAAVTGVQSGIVVK